MHGIYYDLLSEGFRNGHLYIPLAPHPLLLAQKNPHDMAHSHLWWGDLTLHEGRYYLYWGPLPALLQAIGKSLAGVHHMVGDQYLTFAFSALCATFGTLIIERLARRLFPSVPLGMIVAAMLAFAFSNPMLFLIATGDVYQAAIVGGQAFLLGGVLFAFDAVWNAGTTRAAYRELALAGTCWGLALTCRVSLAPALALIGLGSALASAWPLRGRGLRALGGTLAVAAPMAAAMLLLFTYNELRFGRWLEFGLAEAVTRVPWGFSKKYIPAGLYSYATRDADWSCLFPFAHSEWNLGVLNGLTDWPGAPADFRVSEPLVGWLRAVPITWFGPVALLAGARGLRVLRRDRGGATADGRGAITLAWGALCFATIGSVSGVPALGQFFATMRYLADVTSGLALLGILGAFALYASTRTAIARRLACGGFYALGAATVVMGLLLGYQGYSKQFKVFNPSLDAKLTRALSVCPAWSGARR
jgi:hypothetical protein